MKKKKRAVAASSPPLVRLPGWEDALHELIADRLTMPFEWGRNDCALWAADAVHAMTGRDLAAPWRGTYSTPRGAVRIVARGGGIEARVGGVLGDAIAPLSASYGDVGLLVDPDSGREVLGICHGADWLVVAEEGLTLLPLTCARLAWRV